MRQFPMEARTGVRNTQHRPSAQDFSVQVTEAQMDIIGLQHKAMRHRRAGEVAEAMDLEAQIARRLADIAVFKSGLAGMVDALGKEGGS